MSFNLRRAITGFSTMGLPTSVDGLKRAIHDPLGQTANALDNLGLFHDDKINNPKKLGDVLAAPDYSAAAEAAKGPQQYAYNPQVMQPRPAPQFNNPAIQNNMNTMQFGQQRMQLPPQQQVPQQPQYNNQITGGGRIIPPPSLPNDNYGDPQNGQPNTAYPADPRALIGQGGNQQLTQQYMHNLNMNRQAPQGGNPMSGAPNEAQNRRFM